MSPSWPFLLMYESHNMRHTGLSQVDGGQRDPRELGRHTWLPNLGTFFLSFYHFSEN